MKILQVINSLMTGGAEKLVIDTSIRFVENGLSVDILLLDGVQTSLSEKIKTSKKIGLLTLGLNNNLYNPLNIFRISKFLKNYDLIHVHLFPSLYWVAFSKLITFNKIKLVYTEHNTTNRRRNSLFFKLFDKFVYSNYSRIITISNAVDSNLNNYLGSKFNQKIKKIYNGIDLSIIENAEEYTKSFLNFYDTDIILLMVASFTPQKDQKTLIKAMCNLPANYKLLLVGDGPLKKECVNFTKRNNLEKRVLFLGLRTDVPELLKTVDIVVLSSHYEGLSLASIEGMASGKPFIGSRVPGLEEIVINSGVLFNQGDDLQLSNEIKSLINDAEYCKNISSSCMKKALEFDIKIMVENYINLYRSLK